MSVCCKYWLFIQPVYHVDDWYSQRKYKLRCFKMTLGWFEAQVLVSPIEKNKTIGRKSEKDKSDENNKYFSSLGNWMGTHGRTWDFLALYKPCMILLSITSSLDEWTCENTLLKQKQSKNSKELWCCKSPNWNTVRYIYIFFLTWKTIFTNQNCAYSAGLWNSYNSSTVSR